jgi:hypothetical protein
MTPPQQQLASFESFHKLCLTVSIIRPALEMRLHLSPPMICTKTNKRIFQNTVYKNSKMEGLTKIFLQLKAAEVKPPDAIVVAKPNLQVWS